MARRMWLSSPLTIDSFLFQWEGNDSPEVAEKLLEVLAEARSIRFIDKVAFLASLLESQPSDNNRVPGIRWRAVKILFDLFQQDPKALSQKPNSLGSSASLFHEIQERGFAVYPIPASVVRDAEWIAHREILDALGKIPIHCTEGWQHKIKKYLHQILNLDRKALDPLILRQLLPAALIHHGMYEELVQTDFSPETLSVAKRFAEHIFGPLPVLTHLATPPATSPSYAEFYQDAVKILYPLIVATFRDREKKYDQHAVSALQRMLAVSGDLESAIMVKQKEEAPVSRIYEPTILSGEAGTPEYILD